MTATAADGEGLATRRAPLLDERPARGIPPRQLHGPPAGHGVDRFGGAGASRRRPTSARAPWRSRPGAHVPGRPRRRDRRRRARAGVSGLHSGVNPISGDFSTGAEGLRISGGALGEPVKEFTIASTLQRMLQDVQAVGSDLTWLPMSAAGVTLVIGDVTVSGR